MTIGDLSKKRARWRSGEDFGSYNNALLALMNEKIAKEFGGNRRAYLAATAPELLWKPKRGHSDVA